MATKTIKPILDSILDTDAYKFYMQQAVYHMYPNVEVKAEFKCRGNEKLGFLIHKIKEQISIMTDISLTNTEYKYLNELPYFKTDYLNYLKDFRFQPNLVDVENINGELAITITGKWLDVILWEIPILAIVSELFHGVNNTDSTKNINNAIDNLKAKLKLLDNKAKSIDLSKFHFIDFGTRRRFSKDVQIAVIDHLIENCSYFVGTSNVHFARIKNLTPTGTQAHEWFQAHQQLTPKLGQFQKLALESWLKEYPDQLGIALTDCINMDAFLADLKKPLADKYIGLRHDSGDPIIWGEKAIEHYKNLGIDPKNKCLVFSDGLTFNKAIEIYEHFYKRTQVSFGIGTNLTCDLHNINSLNIVLKLTECEAKPVAKISDAPGKTISHDLNFIKILKQEFAIA